MESPPAPDQEKPTTPPETAAQHDEPKDVPKEASPPEVDEAEVNSLDDELPVEAQNPLSNTAGIDQTPKESKTKGAGLKALRGKQNIYVIFFVLLLVVGGAVTAVSFMKGSKKPPVASIGNQALSQDSLNQLANSDASLGSSARTLTVQSSAVFSGQVLVRGALTVASNLQIGGSIQAPSIVISGTANLGATQIKSLQVASDAVLQGTSSLKDLTVSGSSTFNGPMTASQITVTKLILSGNASLQVPNHISFNGPTPGRAANAATLGGGGTVSVSGSDTSGTVSINTGNGPAAGCFVQITFNQAFTNSPHVILSPVGAATGALPYYVTRTTTSFSVCTSNAPSSGTVYAFDYFITN